MWRHTVVFDRMYKNAVVKIDKILQSDFVSFLKKPETYEQNIQTVLLRNERLFHNKIPQTKDIEIAHSNIKKKIFGMF